MSLFTAIRIFHHPDGVLLPGETAELSDDIAARGLEAGTIGKSDEPIPAPAPEVVAPEVEDIVPDETQE